MQYYLIKYKKGEKMSTKIWQNDFLTHNFHYIYCRYYFRLKAQIYDSVTLALTVLFCVKSENENVLLAFLIYLNLWFHFSSTESHVAEGYATSVESQRDCSVKLISDFLMIVLHYAWIFHTSLYCLEVSYIY